MRLLFLIVFISFSSLMYGQLNFKVGYDLTYNRAPILNDIISAYNKENTTGDIATGVGRLLEDNLSELRFVGGLELGIRYSFGRTSIEANISNMSKTSTASGFNLDTDTDINQSLYYNFNRYSLGYQYAIGAFGYGVSVGSRKAKIRSNVTASDVRLTLVEDRDSYLRAYFIYRLPGLKTMNLNLMPYIEVPFGNTDMTNVQNRILSEPTGAGDLNESFPIFGISFVFYNGPSK